MSLRLRTSLLQITNLWLDGADDMRDDDDGDIRDDNNGDNVGEAFSRFKFKTEQNRISRTLF